MGERGRQERSRRSTKSRSRGLPRMALVFGGATVVVIAVIIAFSLRGRPAATEAPSAAVEHGTVGQVLSVDSPRSSAGEVQVGRAAPNFRWRDASGATRSLANLRGRSVVLLEFLATWCPHCQRMAPVIAAVYDDYRDRAVTALGVNASPYAMDKRSPASPADMATFADRFGATFPLAFDPRVAVGRAYGVRSFPTTVIIDRQGIVRYAHSGEAPKAELAAVLTAALRAG